MLQNEALEHLTFVHKTEDRCAETFKRSHMSFKLKSVLIL